MFMNTNFQKDFNCQNLIVTSKVTHVFNDITKVICLVGKAGNAQKVQLERLVSMQLLTMYNQR